MAKAKTKDTNIDPATASKKEMDAKRKEVTAYYKENIPHLETQLKYEELLRDIEKTRAERLQAQMFIAQTMAAPSEEEEKEDSNTMRAEFNANADGAEAARQIKRTLKRETNGV
tara:strand:- start:697 stop:1038 length:342 start_codon:yes stop_codon:yes gene_type:complete